MTALSRALSAGSLVLFCAGLTALLVDGCALTPPPLPAAALPALPAAAERARQLLDDGYYARADSAGTAALDSLSGASVSDSLELAGLLDVVVEALLRDQRGGTDPRAESFARRSCTIRESRLGHDHPGVSRSLCLLAQVWMERNDFVRATDLAGRAVRIAAAGAPAADLHLADALFVLARIRYNSGDTPGADSLATRAHAIRTRLLPVDDRRIAETARLLAYVALDRGRMADADSLARVALDVDRRSLGEGHPETALQASLLGVVRMFQARFAEADSIHRLVLASLERRFPPDHPIIARELFRAGNALAWGYHLEEALPYQKRALRIFEERFGPDVPAVADVCSSLGDLYSVLGDPALARPLLERALAIRERVAGPSSLDTALSLDRLGEFLLLNGQPSKAQPLLERALALRRKLLPPGHGDIAWSLERLARCYVALDRGMGRARPLLTEAIPIFLAAGPDHPSAGRGYAWRSNLAVEDGRYRDAIEDEKRSLAIYDRTYGEQSEAVAWGRYTLACAYWGLGDWDDARKEFRAAASRFGESFGASEWAATESRVSLGMVLLADGRDHEAFEAAMQGLDSENRFLRASARVETEEQGLRLAEGHTRALHLALTLAAGPLRSTPDVARRALDALVRERALVLDEMGARHHAYSARDAGVDSLLQRFVDASRTYANLYVRMGAARDTSGALRQRLAAAGRERDEAERVLADRSQEFRHDQTESRCGLDDVARALEPGSALVSFVRYERARPDRRGPGRPGHLNVWGWCLGPSLAPIPSYLAFVLRSGERTPRIVPLGSAKGIEQLVSDWRGEVGRPVPADAASARRGEARYREAALRLRRAVWDPVAGALSGVRHAFIVPDGALCLVNFATLPVGTASYLVERDPSLHYLSAERDLAAAFASPDPGRGLLALGAPDFDARPDRASVASLAGGGTSRVYRGQRATCGEFRAARFASLPGSGEEVEEIASMWPDGYVVRLLGPAATETAFKALAPGHEIVHVATHGFFVGGDCPTVLDAVRGIGGTIPAEAPPDPGPEAASPPDQRPPGMGTRDVPESPLLLSGLALAGANHRDEAAPDRDDGILTAEEIAAMDLSGVRWAVLSACETGVGEIQAGEGVLGLRRAFRVAGVRTTIMSLWWVDDQATREWMGALYRSHVRRGRTTAQSVRDASLEMLRARRARRESTHPFTWGAFVASGDWR